MIYLRDKGIPDSGGVLGLLDSVMNQNLQSGIPFYFDNCTTDFEMGQKAKQS